MSIDVHAFDRTWYAQADHGTVIAFEALAARFPAVHPLAIVIEHAFFPHRRGRLEQAVGISEPVIGDRDDFGAQTGIGQVDELLERYGVSFHSSCLPLISWLGMLAGSWVYFAFLNTRAKLARESVIGTTLSC